MDPISVPKWSARDTGKHENWRHQRQQRSRKLQKISKQHQTTAKRPQNGFEKDLEKRKDGGHKQWPPSRCQNDPQETPKNTKISASTANSEARNRQRPEQKHQMTTKQPQIGPKKEPEKHKDGGHKRWPPSPCSNDPQETSQKQHKRSEHQQKRSRRFKKT